MSRMGSTPRCCQLATANGSPDVGLRLVKFYAIFKDTEIQRYRELRGFPRKAAGAR